MNTMNISLPDTLKYFIDDQVRLQDYSTSSEYVQELIRKEKSRIHLKNLLLEGAASPSAGSADDAYFATLRNRVLQHT